MFNIKKHLIPIKYLYFNIRNCSTIKRIELYKKCYAILGVDEASDQNTVRRAYIELVKLVHPDSGNPESSVERFQDVDKAFKILQTKFSKTRHGIYEDEEEKVFDINHTAPQHRQYLTFDGIGVGNPFQRQKQFQQAKAMKAQNHVLNYRIEKSQAVDEKSLIKKDGSFYKNHAIKTKYGFDRVVEDLIQEAMSKGDFDNLSCSGKPLSSVQSQNPYLDFTTAKLNKIMIDNGFTPEWITLQRDVREALQTIKIELKKQRAYLGELPLNPDEQIQWQTILNNYETTIQKINKNIDKFNLIVPILYNQMCRIRLKTLGDTILNDKSIQCNKQRSKNDNYAKDEHNKYEEHNILKFIGSLFSSK